MRRKKKSTNPAKGYRLTSLILDFYKKPALAERFHKNPKAVAKQYGLTAAQVAALKSRSTKRIVAQVSKETTSLFRIRPWMGGVMGPGWQGP